jgi:hypothetical protein
MSKLEYKMKKKKNIKEMKLRELRNKNKKREKEKMIGKNFKHYKKSRLKTWGKRMQRSLLK